MKQLDLFAAELVTLNPPPRAPFVIKTAIALGAAPLTKRRDLWRAAVRELTDPLLAAGMSHADATAYALSFRHAVEVAMFSGDDDDGGPGTRADISTANKQQKAA